MGFPTWEPASRCTGGPAPGAKAFMRWFVEDFGQVGGYNLGIYNCRSVRGGRTTSMHGEGRATDLGFPVGDVDGDRLCKMLIANAGKLGIQCIIYERRLYSKKHPNGTYYGGVAPHWDHIHVEFTHEAAERLTYATVKNILSPKVFRPGVRMLTLNSKGDDVKVVQRVVGVKADGYYGPATKAAVLKWERAMQKKYPNLLVDGIVGNKTWELILAA